MVKTVAAEGDRQSAELLPPPPPPPPGVTDFLGSRGDAAAAALLVFHHDVSSHGLIFLFLTGLDPPPPLSNSPCRTWAGRRWGTGFAEGGGMKSAADMNRDSVVVVVVFTALMD